MGGHIPSNEFYFQQFDFDLTWPWWV
jgi:hypothetical protein